MTLYTGSLVILFICLFLGQYFYDCVLCTLQAATVVAAMAAVVAVAAGVTAAAVAAMAAADTRPLPGYTAFIIYCQVPFRKSNLFVMERFPL